MKFGVVVFPGSNCDEDMVYVLRDIMKQETVKLWHKNTDLEGCTHIVLPGGFSYGDYLRSGAIARFSPIMTSVMKHAENGGFVFGVCNGFQILCESGLLPGVLLANANQQFICKNVFIKNPHNEAALPLMIPIAHGEGRYFAADDVLNDLEKNKQIIYTYCDSEGTVHDDHNPNGTTSNIAGIKNLAGNVFGMMPHPERACSAALGNTDGRTVFNELLKINALVAV